MHTLPPFPRYLSLTLTRTCSLRCRMCAQWGPHGYRRQPGGSPGQPLDATEWCALVDSIPANQDPLILLRGGEPLELPHFPRLLESLRARERRVAIDSNGVGLERLAEELAAIGGFHVTISLDGPSEVHDRIRGVPGTYERVRRGVDALRAACEHAGTKISLSLNWTLGPENLYCVGQFPDLARAWGIPVVCVVPRYWVEPSAGREHEQELATFGVTAWAWRGFPKEATPCDRERLLAALEAFRDNLGEIEAYPYMPLGPSEYEDWLSRWEVPVGMQHCSNAWTLLDVQPNGDANFCVDFPDWTIGNVRQESLEQLWLGERANGFRNRISRGLLPACRRCGAKYMSRQCDPEP